MKNAISKIFSTVTLILVYLSMSAQATMNLGSLEFVLPTRELSASSRTLKMKMAKVGYSSRFYARVGGVAFIQTATPDFEIDSLELNYDSETQKSVAIINGKSYTIPLEYWKLQPIVQFANDEENNAAITIFGEEPTRIRYHEAFIDELVGLRLLQTDLLLASSLLSPEERGKFPSDENGEFIMADSEKASYELMSQLYSLFSNATYQDISFNASLQLYSLLLEEPTTFDTYVFTDKGEDISFTVASDTLLISGNPYYQFARRDTSAIDTLDLARTARELEELYFHRMKTLGDVLGKQSSELYESPDGNAFRIMVRELLGDNSKTEKERAECLAELFNCCDYKDQARQTLSSILTTCKNVTHVIDSVKTATGKFVGKDELVVNIVSLIENIVTNNWHALPEARLWSMVLIANYMGEDFVWDIFMPLADFKLSNDDIFKTLLAIHTHPYTELLHGLTEKLKSNWGVVYMLNPIVYDCAIDVCRWSAFFRYIKENHVETWNNFVNLVNFSPGDKISVVTPVDFKTPVRVDID